MQYTTLAELDMHFGAREILDLADRDRDGIADAGVVDAAIAEAGQIIDSHLRSRYTVPLVEIPGLIATCARRIVRYTLSEGNPTDVVKADYEEAVKWLLSIRRGEMDVGITATNTAPEVDTGGPQHHSGTQAFPQQALDAWSGKS